MPEEYGAGLEAILGTFWCKTECLTRCLSIRAVPHFCNSVRIDVQNIFANLMSFFA
jgi:hypothetical protein